MTKSLQDFDGIVKSVKDTRKAYHDMTDKKFATMYEDRYKVPYHRVMTILQSLKEAEENDQTHAN